MLTKMKVEILGFDKMKELYDSDPSFFEMWRECRAPSLTEKLCKCHNYFIQEGMLFKEFNCIYQEVL